MGDVGAAYAACRERIIALVVDLAEERTQVRVPACPEWTVHDVVAHVAGVVDDALAGRLDGVATDPWTAAQVDARRDVPIKEIVREWDVQAPQFEQLLDAIGDPGRQAVADVVTHEQDIRGALGVAGARDSDAIDIALGFLAPRFLASAAAHGVSLRVGEFGAADAALTLSGDSFELVRAMTGRRSVEQLRGLSWDGDPSAVIPAFTFGPFQPAASRVDE